MGNYTDKLTGQHRRTATLRRKGQSDVDLMEFRNRTPSEALGLLSDETREGVEQLTAASRQEIGQTLRNLADALSRVIPPAIRIDFQSGVQSGWLAEITINGETYSKRTSPSPESLPALAVDSVGTLARYASEAVPREMPQREELQAKVFEQWAKRLQQLMSELRTHADLLRIPMKDLDNAESLHGQ